MNQSDEDEFDVSRAQNQERSVQDLDQLLKEIHGRDASNRAQNNMQTMKVKDKNEVYQTRQDLPDNQFDQTLNSKAQHHVEIPRYMQPLKKQLQNSLDQSSHEKFNSSRRKTTLESSGNHFQNQKSSVTAMKFPQERGSHEDGLKNVTMRIDTQKNVQYQGSSEPMSSENPHKDVSIISDGVSDEHFEQMPDNSESRDSPGQAGNKDQLQLSFMRHTKSSIVKEKSKQEVEAEMAKKKKENKKQIQIGGPKTFSIEFLQDPQSPTNSGRNSQRAQNNLSQSFHQGMPAQDLKQTIVKPPISNPSHRKLQSSGGQGGNLQISEPEFDPKILQDLQSTAMQQSHVIQNMMQMINQMYLQMKDNQLKSQQSTVNYFDQCNGKMDQMLQKISENESENFFLKQSLDANKIQSDGKEIATMKHEIQMQISQIQRETKQHVSQEINSLKIQIRNDLTHGLVKALTQSVTQQIQEVLNAQENKILTQFAENKAELSEEVQSLISSDQQLNQEMNQTILDEISKIKRQKPIAPPQKPANLNSQNLECFSLNTQRPQEQKPPLEKFSKKQLKLDSLDKNSHYQPVKVIQPSIQPNSSQHMLQQISNEGQRNQRVEEESKEFNETVERDEGIFMENDDLPESPKLRTKNRESRLDQIERLLMQNNEGKFDKDEQNLLKNQLRTSIKNMTLDTMDPRQSMGGGEILKMILLESQQYLEQTSQAQDHLNNTEMTPNLSTGEQLIRPKTSQPQQSTAVKQRKPARDMSEIDSLIFGGMQEHDSDNELNLDDKLPKFSRFSDQILQEEQTDPQIDEQKLELDSDALQKVNSTPVVDLAGQNQGRRKKWNQQPPSNLDLQKQKSFLNQLQIPTTARQNINFRPPADSDDIFDKALNSTDMPSSSIEINQGNSASKNEDDEDPILMMLQSNPEFRKSITNTLRKSIQQNTGIKRQMEQKEETKRQNFMEDDPIQQLLSAQMSPKRNLKQTVAKNLNESPQQNSEEEIELNQSNASSANHIDEEENSAIDLIAHLLNQQKLSDKSVDQLLRNSKQSHQSKGPSTHREQVYNTASKNSNPFSAKQEQPQRAYAEIAKKPQKAAKIEDEDLILQLLSNSNLRDSIDYSKINQQLKGTLEKKE